MKYNLAPPCIIFKWRNISKQVLTGLVLNLYPPSGIIVKIQSSSFGKKFKSFVILSFFTTRKQRHRGTQRPFAENENDIHDT